MLYKSKYALKRTVQPEQLYQHFLSLNNLTNGY